MENNKNDNRANELIKSLELLSAVFFILCLKFHKPFGSILFLLVFVLADDVINGLRSLKKYGIKGFVGEHNIRMAVILVILVVLYLYYKWFK